jgi:hypothetical protein
VKLLACIIAVFAGLLLAGTAGAALHLVKVGSFDHPVYVAATPADPSAIYVVEQPGTIKRLAGGKVTTFLDLRSTVQWGGEQGLLSVAFSPDYAKSKLFYIDYTAHGGGTVIAEYRAGSGAPARTRVLVQFGDPAANHNGGQLVFGPDGYLWWGNGDGGGGGDTYGNGQRATGNFAKIKRLDTHSRAVRWLTWAVGLRNPWRFSFDRATGALYIGDVGQNKYEEIDYVAKGRSHLNFGWNHYEGFAAYGDERLLAGWTYVRPLVAYDHGKGCSVTGGYVYRGKAVKPAVGRYFYGDYCSGTIWSLTVSGGKARDVRVEPFRVPGLSSFGEDVAGELYLMSVDNGSVFRLAG